MKRAEKIALLSKLLAGQVSEVTRQQLHQSNGPGGIVIFYQPGAPRPGPDDTVSFHHKGQQVTMPYRYVKAFTRYDPLTVCFMPDNHRRHVKHVDGDTDDFPTSN